MPLETGAVAQLVESLPPCVSPGFDPTQHKLGMWRSLQSHGRWRKVRSSRLSSATQEVQGQPKVPEILPQKRKPLYIVSILVNFFRYFRYSTKVISEGLPG